MYVVYAESVQLFSAVAYLSPVVFVFDGLLDSDESASRCLTL